MWVFWLGSAIVGAGMAFDKWLTPSWAKGPNHSDNAVSGKPKKPAFPFWTIGSILLSTVMGFAWFFLLRRKPAANTDLDYYKGALGLTDAECVGKSKAYMAGLLKRKKEEKFALSKDIATDLPVQNVTITRGRGFRGG